MPKRKDSFSDLPDELKTPIEIDNIFKKVSVLSAGSQKAYEARIKELAENQKQYISTELEKKFDILAAHLDVDLQSKDGWRELAQAMAVKYFEGFKVRFPLTAGRKKKWDSLTLFRLCYEVYMAKQRKKQSVANICRHLVNKAPWDTLLISSNKEDAGEALHKLYRKAKNDPIVKAFLGQLESSHEEIQKQVHHIYDLVCSGEIEALK